MKYLTSLPGVITLAACCTLSTSAEFKLISLLRGDAPAQAASAWQRVAFIGPAAVRAVAGHAERLCGIDRWCPLSPGTPLVPGDVIRATSGTVILKLDQSESYVRLNAQTVLRLLPDSVEATGSTVVASAGH